MQIVETQLSEKSKAIDDYYNEIGGIYEANETSQAELEKTQKLYQELKVKFDTCQSSEISCKLQLQ